MSYSSVFADLRKGCGFTQKEVAEYITRKSHRTILAKQVSHWETGYCAPSIEIFLMLCECYGVRDIQDTFRGVRPEYRNIRKLNEEGRALVEDLVDALSGNPQYLCTAEQAPSHGIRTAIPLFDIRVAAGTGTFLDGDSSESFIVDSTVPEAADLALRISGDSMAPRFVDGQIVFVSEQSTLDVGEIGIFSLNGDAYIKKLGHNELLSINTAYKPIQIHAYDELHVFGKVIG